jgi:hypothetical protein
MDTDRRRKTVIAGTFAIGRKSLSNAQPISADETQRTKAEMTMASTHMPTLHEARAERHLRRVANQVFHSVEAVEAGARGKGWRGVDSKNPRQDDRQGKSVDRRARWPSHLAIFHFFFSTTPPIFLRPEIFQP